MLCWPCAAVARLVARVAVSPSESSSVGSIFVFVPSAEDVAALAGALQQRLQQPTELQQQQQPQESPPPPVEIVCLAPGTIMSCLQEWPFPVFSHRTIRPLKHLPLCYTSHSLELPIPREGGILRLSTSNRCTETRIAGQY